MQGQNYVHMVYIRLIAILTKVMVLWYFYIAHFQLNDLNPFDYYS